MGKRLFWILTGVLSCLVLTVGALNIMKFAKAGTNRFENTKLVVYEGPKSLRDATPEDLKAANEQQRDIALLHCTDTKVTVNGTELYVYDTNVNHSRTWNSSYLPALSRTPITYFDFEGVVRITVTVPDRALDSVKISPLSYGIKPKIDKAAHTVSFLIDTPDSYTVTFDDSPARALHIFANPLEKEEDIPDPEDDKVIYIGPGEWDIDSISLESGQTLYIAGGAVVHSDISANFVKNVRVCGRGIIDGSGYKGWAGKTAYIPLKFDFTQDCSVEGVIVTNPNAWCLQGYATTGFRVDNVKIISCRPNGDGITLQSCKNAVVTNCFVRSWDDSLVVKNYADSSENITFRHMRLWTDLAQSMEIGYETNKGSRENSTLSHVTFEDICVLNGFHKPVISIHNADDALVSDIVFKDITVENLRTGSGDGAELPYFVDIAVVSNGNWSTTRERGQIRDITIENVTVLDGAQVGSRIAGYDETHTVSGVHFKNVTVFGKKIKSLEDGGFKVKDGTFSDITFE